MGKTAAAIVVAIVLLTAGAILLVHRLTEPPAGSGAAAGPGGVADQPGGAGTDPGPAYQAGGGPGAPILVPPRPPPPGPVLNEAPPIQGPAPVALPADAGERGEALQSIQQRRRDAQLQRINRRNQERLGGAATNDVPPSPPVPE